MDRLAIAISNQALGNQALGNVAGKMAREPAGHDISEPRAGRTLPTSPAAPSSPVSVADTSLPRVTTPALAASMNASLNSMAPISVAASTLSAASQTMSATHVATHVGGMPISMTAAAPAATVLPSVTLQPNIAPQFERTSNDKLLDRSLNEKPVTERAVDKILSDKSGAERPAIEKPSLAAASLMASGVTPLTPAALSAVVAPMSPRANLRVVPKDSPLAASLPSATATHAGIADAPMAPLPSATATQARIADAPMAPPAPAQAAPPVLAVPVPPAPVPIMPAATPTPRHEEQVFRVLAVDDSPLMRTFLQNKLAPYGIQPEFAASGEEALFKISKQHYDMIFLDVMLPGMDGYDVCKMIKKNKDNNLMKVVMLTSKDKTFDKIRGTMAGCDGYLTKPVDELKLRAIIERHTVTRK
jgi:CheY-like chemotaxis protein